MKSFTLLGEFANPEEEARFQTEKWPDTRKRMRSICAISALAYLSAMCIDYRLLHHGSGLAIMAGGRITVFLFGLASVLFTLPTACAARRLGWMAGAYMLSLMLCESMELTVKVGLVDIQGIPPSVVILLTFYFILPPKVLPTLVACVVGSGVFILTMLFLPSIPTERFINILLFFLVANGFGFVFLTRYGLAQRREFQALEKLKWFAEMDELTQVYNRRKVLEIGERMFKEAQRHRHPLSLLLMDIDHFKSINDQHGHVAGDRVLREVATRIKANLREVDAFGRIGGEEFVVFLPYTNKTIASDIAERLRATICAPPIDAGEQSIDVRLCIGVAEFTPETHEMNVLMHNADMALYQAKSAGRNRVACFCDGQKESGQ